MKEIEANHRWLSSTTKEIVGGCSVESKNSKFADLLNSQQEIVSDLKADSGDILFLFFGSHRIEDSQFGEEAPAEHDVVLISLWLNTSKDPVVGNEQKSCAFWKRITAYFAVSMKLAGCEHREPSRSVKNETDVLKLAHEIFFNNYHKKFTLEHAWKELRNDQKWCDLSNPKTERSSKRRTTEADQVTIRPPGVKASKGNCNQNTKAEGKSVTEFQSMCSIKKEDLAMKESLSKMKLLVTLIANRNRYLSMKKR
ncbi:hypothetical protein N665_0591s0011 [Sinapis alba]|nr:hypothetical protein N665_0591s0011 [Sinapis alba]